MIAWRNSFQGLLLDGKIRFDVDVSRLDALVAEPQGNDSHIDSGLQQVHSAGVAPMSLKT